MAELSRVIELRRNQDMTAAIAAVNSGQGKRLMDSVRAEMAAFLQIERDALAQREAQFQSNMRRLFAIMAAASLLTLLLALSFAYLIHRETQHRLRNLVHLETQHLLEIQQETNRQLKQANLTLQVSEENLSVTLNSIGDAVIATDAEGRVTRLNPLAEQLTGWTQAQATGRLVDEIFHIINQETRQPALIPVKDTLAHGTIHGLANHTVLIALGGSECAIADSCAPIRDRDGQVIGTVLVFRDVTQEYAAQRALQESNVELEKAKSAAENANRAKSDFLSHMSHELRSPLSAILGFAQLMETATPLPTTAQATRIAQILKAGGHLLTLINEILDLAVIESGKVSLSQEPVSLAEIMTECQTMMEPQAQLRGIRMTFPKFDNHSFVWADRTRLKQIVINLLSNAIKYNKEHGTVVVDCTMISPNRTRISIKDTGAGLVPEKVVQLFQPFNRLGQEAGGVGGAGIGLVVTKQLAELMDGVLGVESTVGKGSLFWIELRSTAAPTLVGRGAAPPPHAQLRRPADARLRTLLYVEDNPANMMLVEQLIAQHSDLRMLTAVNGTLGIKLARAAQPDVILMDINLPGISGIETLKLLHEDPATTHIPVVALSANAMPRDIEKGLEAGFFSYLTKPIKVKEFSETLNEALEFAEKTAGQST
jgi:PAS domain S-box-containing protein